MKVTKRAFECAIKHLHPTRNVRDMIDESHFDHQGHKWLLHEIIKYFDKYHTTITLDTLKIEVKKITSDEFFQKNTKFFNFIYIDGCHIGEFIKRDMENSFKFLEINGIMWMDDYLANNETKNTMDLFLEKYKGKYYLIHKGYQLAIKKLEN
jgi:hypothetical protein